MDALNVLTAAESAQTVDDILNQTFRFRYDGLSETRAAQWSALLSITAEQAASLYKCLNKLIRESLYSGAQPATINDLFPSDFSEQLKKLLIKLIVKNAPQWREVALSTLISAPKLIDFDWRVDVKTSSNLLTHMSVPTVLVGMKVMFLSVSSACFLFHV